VSKWRHEELSVFGVGADLSESAWRGVLRHLIALGVLEVDHESYGTLVLTDASRAVLKGERRLMLRRQTLQGTTRSGRVPRAAGAAAALGGAAGALFERLRAWRAATAREHGVPAYVIFHDATLRELAQRQPATLDELSEVSGVGARKLESYGQAILELLGAGPDGK
jgi:ATP-dependent DNA helicase RecQ